MYETTGGESIETMGRDGHGGCDQKGPYGSYVCTREAGHSGDHLAGVGMTAYVARWDDDRTTDNYPPNRSPRDFFKDLGL